MVFLKMVILYRVVNGHFPSNIIPLFILPCSKWSFFLKLCYYLDYCVVHGHFVPKCDVHVFIHTYLHPSCNPIS
jgi:hypothetical protein